MKWVTHRDQLSIFILAAIFALIVINLVAQVRYNVSIPETIWGFLIGIGNYVVIFYFRKNGPPAQNETQHET